MIVDLQPDDILMARVRWGRRHMASHVQYLTGQSIDKRQEEAGERGGMRKYLTPLADMAIGPLPSFLGKCVGKPVPVK